MLKKVIKFIKQTHICSVLDERKSQLTQCQLDICDITDELYNYIYVIKACDTDTVY